MAVFESLLTLTRMETEAFSRRRSGQADPSIGFALEGRFGEIYNEEAFRHFLAIERVRAERSGRPLLLLLVGLHRCPKAGARIGRAQSAALFSGLGECVREVDFVGWYREGRVLGAVLTQGLETPTGDAHSRIVDRVGRVLRGYLPDSLADRLRLRVVQLGTRVGY